MLKSPINFTKVSRIVSKTKTLTKLSYKFSKNLFTKGPIESLRITKKFLSERKNPQVSTEQQNAELMKVQDILKETFGGLKPIQTLFVENNKLRINFLTPALNESSLFGGTTTGLIFATLLGNSLNA